MQGTAFWFFASATLYVTVGMGWGIMMAATEDFALSPAHAHLNLVGWVTMGLFGLYYHLVPETAETWLAKVHFAVATVGLWLIVPGIVMVVQGGNTTVAKVGSVLTLLSMLIFVATVFRSRVRRPSALAAG